MNSQPIFLFGAHKSGTTLLKNLFEGHSQLYCIPIETHVFQYMRYWILNKYRFQIPEKIDRTQVINNFINFIKEINVSENKYGGFVAKGIFDISRFEQSIASINQNDDDSTVIRKYFKAIHYSISGRQLEESKRVVEKSVEHAELAGDLYRLFPEAKFIHIIRNPYSNFVSLRKFKSINVGYPKIWRMINTLYINYFFLNKNQRNIKNYYVIRYEDLVQNPEVEIRKICDFLSIDFEPTLLEPTFLGKPWHGNSMTGKKFVSISSDGLERWKKEISPMEIEFINKKFSFILDKFGYEKFTTNKNFWIPAKGENILRYIANRMYKFYM